MLTANSDCAAITTAIITPGSLRLQTKEELQKGSCPLHTVMLQESVRECWHWVLPAPAASPGHVLLLILATLAFWVSSAARTSKLKTVHLQTLSCDLELYIQIPFH